ncbi:protein FAM222B isoform X1 [Pogona vitticeps]
MMNPPSAPYPAAPSTLSHSQALARQQALQHAQGVGPPPPPPPPPGLGHPGLPPPGNHVLQPLAQPQLPPGAGVHGGRKMADADAPPNVTVSTSTIPLSMAATLQQHPPPDLSTIVHQINQFCQARAGVSATSVCEGQIANPSPISRNLLISASSRVSAHHAPGPLLPSCLQANPGEHGGPPAGPALGVHLGNAAGRGPSAYQSDMKQVAAAWSQHQLAHLQRMCGEAVGPSGMMAKPAAGRDLPGQAFPGGKGYGLELCPGQPFSVKPPLEKPTPSPPVNGLPGPLPYTNGSYFQPLWNNILPTPNSDSSGSQDLAMPFHTAAAGQPPPPMGGPALECAGGPPPYRGGAGGGPPGQGGLMPPMEYLSGDLQASCLREQGGGVLGKAPRPSMNRAPEPVLDSRSLHIQHPGYR